jgi:hypothetical protein
MFTIILNEGHTEIMTSGAGRATARRLAVIGSLRPLNYALTKR